MSGGRLRRFLILAGGAVLFVSAVVLEPQTTADMAVVVAGTAALLAGLYLSRRAEAEEAERAEREKEMLGVVPDTVPEGEELPRRDASDGQP